MNGILKRYLISALLFLTLTFAQNENVFKFLENLKDVGEYSIDKFEIELTIMQPMDHNNPDSPKFPQRVFIKHAGFDKPVVLHTRGYYARPGSETELRKILRCNEIEVEHRYFPPSIPAKEVRDWKYMKAEQAAADHHRVVEIFKEYYTGKWINTGASKGGQTAMWHRYFYPKDVDVTVAYVAPLNLEMEDKRTPEFIRDSIATETEREIIREYQKALLERRDEIIPLVKKDLEKKKIIIDGDFNYAYELAVFEFEFSWWQYGSSDMSEIPGPDAPAEELFEKFKGTIDFFGSREGVEFKPFNYQAYTELGFYSYDTEPLQDYLKYIDTRYASFRDYMLPEQWKDIKFDGTDAKNLNDWLTEHGNNMIYIFGEYDPWSAPGFRPTPGKTNALRMVLPKGNHGSNILKFEGEQREKIITTLEKWLEVEINRRRLNYIR